MDRNTPWRSLGPTTRDAWKAWLLKRGSPMLAEADSTYDAAAPHHRLIAGMLWAESQASRDMRINPYSSMNPLNHRNVDNPDWYYGGKPGPSYMTYPDWSTCIRATIKRLSYPGYKNGVYADKLSLIDMISTYAPASDGNSPTNYVDTVLLIANELPTSGTPTPTPTPTPTKRTWRDVAKKSDIRISQPFGDPSPDEYGPSYGVPKFTHVGLDIGSMPRGTILLSLTEGIVEYATPGSVDQYYRPLYLIIKRDNGHRLLYGHMWELDVDVGKRVNAGTSVLGLSGEQTKPGTWTPDGTGPHLHLEVWTTDSGNDSGFQAVDPATYDFGTAEGGQPTPEPQPPSKYSTAIPGLPGGPLGTSYPIRISLIPKGNQRSGAKASIPRRSVQHGTGNASNPSAWNEAQYFVGGAEGRGVSVHACIDHTEVVVTLPLDEVGVHAGSALGNANGYASEMIEATATWNDPARRDRLIAIASDFMGRVGARLGVAQPERHANFGNPACPAKLQTVRIGGRLAWDIYAQQWQAARVDELKRMAGEVPPIKPPPKPEPQPPMPPTPTPPKPPVTPPTPQPPKPPKPPDDAGDWTHER